MIERTDAPLVYEPEIKILKLSDKSSNSKKILSYFKRKYCEKVAIVGLIKSCSIVSCNFKEFPRLNVCVVAPTRQLKSRTSHEQKGIFTPKYYIDMGSDFSLHGIHKDYPTKKSLDRHCLLINDGTLLLSSKSKRSKDRLINGIAEIISDGVYIYSDFKGRWKIEGSLTFIFNITLESYKQNKNMLLGNTFLERFLTIYYALTDEELDGFLVNKRVKCDVKYDDKKFNSLKDYELKTDLTKLRTNILKISNEFAIINFRSKIAMYDIVEGLLKAHACFNDRKEIIEDDFIFLEMIRPYLIDLSAPNQHKILQLHNIGWGYKKIANYLDKTEGYTKYIWKVIHLATDRGIIGFKKENNEGGVDE